MRGKKDFENKRSHLKQAFNLTVPQLQELRNTPLEYSVRLINPIHHKNRVDSRGSGSTRLRLLNSGKFSGLSQRSLDK